MANQLTTGRRGEPPALTSLQRQLSRVFDDFFDDFFGRPAGSGDGGGRELLGLGMPSIDVVDDDDELRIEAELPGVDEKDVEVIAAGDTLTIRGEKRAEDQGEEKGRRWSERSYGAFQRVLRLPAPVQADKAEASFEKGVLHIRIPKTGEEKERVRRIPVGGERARQRNGGGEGERETGRRETAQREGAPRSEGTQRREGRREQGG